LEEAALSVWEGVLPLDELERGISALSLEKAKEMLTWTMWIH
jgi:hypothetical protein